MAGCDSILLNLRREVDDELVETQLGEDEHTDDDAAEDVKTGALQRNANSRKR